MKGVSTAMSTENEEILQNHIAGLQNTVEQITLYMYQMHEAIQLNNAAGQQSSTTNFCEMQYVIAYLPFYASPVNCIVSVYEEIGCNKYRPVQPAIEYGGQQITLNFDSPRTGFVTVAQLDTNNCVLAGAPVPPIYTSQPVALLQTIPAPPIECAPLTQKTPVGSEVVKLDEEPFATKDEKAFAKAMGAIKTWPR